MSGHSKWSTIKHKKAAKDARRGKVFTKLIREITVAARGGGDPDFNPTLRTAVAAAKAASMPADNIDRAIKKGTGELEGESYEEIEYEGYGPGGVAIIVRALTDNRNRTVSDIRHLFSRNGGSLGESNCVAWMFDRKGLFTVAEGVEEDALMEVALEAGADDVAPGEEGGFTVTCPPEAFAAVRDALDAAPFAVDSAELTLIPRTTISLSGSEAGTALKLLEALEDHDDVQNVSANLDVESADIEAWSAA